MTPAHLIGPNVHGVKSTLKRVAWAKTETRETGLCRDPEAGLVWGTGLKDVGQQGAGHVCRGPGAQEETSVLERRRAGGARARA